MGRIFYSIFRDWSDCTVRGGCIGHSMRDQVSEEKIAIQKKADPVWRFWNGEKSVTKRLSAQIFVLITARHTESMVKAPQNVALRINVVCPSASPRKCKTKNAYGRSSGLKQRLIKPHAFPYYRKKRHFTVAGGTAETAAGAAGQLAQTSLLNAPISPKHDRLHLGAYLHAPFSFTIIL